MKMEIKNFLKSHQQTIALSVGYLLVAFCAFGLGRITATEQKRPEIRVEESFAPLLNNTQNIGAAQSESIPAVAGESTAASAGNCEGKIKGNIGSKGEKIYHMPGGSFYNRTNPEQCFDTEEAAQAAGFRKSSR